MIGIFDSGVGGLCALAAAKKAMPRADFVYFADEGNLPYGEKEPRELVRLTRRAITLLLAEGAQILLAACGTVSAVALPEVRTDCPVPLLGVLSPAAEAAGRAHAVRGGDILLLGTRATLKSGAFSGEIQKFATHAPIHTLPCPFFVRLAEGGHTAENDPFAAMCVARILAPTDGYPVRTVVLGCTHFSYLYALISARFPHAEPIDAAREAAWALARTHPTCGERGRGEVRLLTSGEPQHLLLAAKRLFAAQGLDTDGLKVPTRVF